jgi:hypothetical protein
MIVARLVKLGCPVFDRGRTLFHGTEELANGIAAKDSGADDARDDHL